MFVCYSKSTLPLTHGCLWRSCGKYLYIYNLWYIYYCNSKHHKTNRMSKKTPRASHVLFASIYISEYVEPARREGSWSKTTSRQTDVAFPFSYLLFLSIQSARCFYQKTLSWRVMSSSKSESLHGIQWLPKEITESLMCGSVFCRVRLIYIFPSSMSALLFSSPNQRASFEYSISQILFIMSLTLL